MLWGEISCMGKGSIESDRDTGRQRGLVRPTLTHAGWIALCQVMASKEPMSSEQSSRLGI